MSTPAPSSQPLPSLDPKVGLAYAVADLLVPLFRGGAIDLALARQTAVNAIDAYKPETRADVVNIARTIALSMASIALLGQSSLRDLPEQMRAFGRANAMSRTADQSERTMMQRRAYQRANRQAERPAPTPAAPDAMFDAEAQAAVAEAVKEYLAVCAPHPTDPAPDTVPQPAPTAPMTAAPQPASPLEPPDATPVSAIHYSDPRFDAGHTRRAPYKDSLLQNTAMQRVTERSRSPHPA
jgi:hypothetical protein